MQFRTFLGFSFLLSVAPLSSMPVAAQTSGVVVPQPRMGEPLAGLDVGALKRFKKGLRAFQHTVTEAEGLGPSFNNRSCSSCHNHPVDGGTSPGLSQSVMRFGVETPTGGFDPLTSLGGSLLQMQGLFKQSPTGEFLSCNEFVPPQATVTSRRISTPMFGLGLVEAVSDQTLASLQQSSVPGISGVVHPVTPLEKPLPVRAGRFGWKAQAATSLTFAADATLNEVGITSRLLPQENAPNGDTARLALCDAVPDPENLPLEGVQFIDSVSDFQRYLAPPPQTPRAGMRGETIFTQVGCANCHVPSMRTGTDAGLETAIAGKEIKPYSDFLLHDMGDRRNGGLGDAIVQGVAAGREMRTAPLWGFVGRQFLGHDAASFTGLIFGAPCFRGSSCNPSDLVWRLDGITRGIHDIVALHAGAGSEAADSANRYLALSAADTLDVTKFMLSLGRSPFDASFDASIDNFDFQRLRDCALTSGISVETDCTVFDLDANGAISNSEYDAFVRKFEGHKGDCNCNGIADPLDILSGAAVDGNRDGIPDNCSLTGPNIAAASCEKPALSFRYPGEYVEIPFHPSLALAANGGGFTVSFWFKPSELPNGKIRTIFDAPGSLSIGLSSSNGKRLTVTAKEPYSVSSVASQTVVSTRDLVLNQWSHVAVVFRNDGLVRSVSLYLNGVKDTELLSMYGPVMPFASALYVGDSPVTGGLAKGQVSKFSLYKRALAESEIASFMNASPSSSDSNLALFLPFAGIWGSTVFDSSGNQNHGTLVGPDTSPPATPNRFFPSRSGSNINISWISDDDNEGDRRYALSLYTSGVLSQQKTLTSAAISIPSPTPGSNFRLDVIGTDGAGNNSKTGSYAFVEETVRPTSPTNLSFKRDLDGTVSLRWNAATDNVGIAGYRVVVYVGTKSLLSTFTESNSFVLEGADPKLSYRVIVLSYDQSGNSGPAAASITIPAA